MTIPYPLIVCHVTQSLPCVSAVCCILPSSLMKWLASSSSATASCYSMASTTPHIQLDTPTILMIITGCCLYSMLEGLRLDKKMEHQTECKAEA